MIPLTLLSHTSSDELRSPSRVLLLKRKGNKNRDLGEILKIQTIIVLIPEHIFFGTVYVRSANKVQEPMFCRGKGNVTVRSQVGKKWITLVLLSALFTDVCAHVCHYRHTMPIPSSICLPPFEEKKNILSSMKQNVKHIKTRVTDASV